ncbi:hypothetical protein Anas_14616 [Armadillidium nasatum]|uniref:Uncharacterized protein n=1 Tax=Armadillidium nasatum TaxID=96803 RepID=A0A5N5SIS4_9CRUS|nr:hypothetical protein Anas_14616 [Armadillidium nasatum]
MYCQGDNKCYTTVIGEAFNMADASLSSFVKNFIFEGFPFWSNKTPECLTFDLLDKIFLCYENFEKLRVVDFIKYTIIHSFKACIIFS